MQEFLKIKIIQTRIFVCFVFAIAVVLAPAIALGVTTVGNDVSVGGTLGVVGATTLTGALVANGNVTLGNAASDSITATGYFLTSISVGNGTTTTSTLASNSLILAKAANFDVGKFYVDSSGNVTASGTLGVVGATTFNGLVNLGDVATDYINATAYFRNTLSVGDGSNTTSTLTYESIVLSQANNFDVGKFYVDSSGNVTASGTLGVVGATTLTGALVANGNVTLGNAASDSITATGYFLTSITVGNGITVTSTLGFDSVTIGSDAVYNLGRFYVNGAGQVFASGTIQTLQATTSTILIDTTSPVVGTCFVVKDVAGTRKYISIKSDNTLLIGTVDCRLGTP